MSTTRQKQSSAALPNKFWSGTRTQQHSDLLYGRSWLFLLEVQQLGTSWAGPAGHMASLQVDLCSAAVGMSQLHHGLIILVQVDLHQVVNAELIPAPLQVL